MTSNPRLALAAASLAATALVVALVERPAHAQAAKPLQVKETNVEGVNAEVVEAVRKEGVLTIKIRYRNGGASPAKVVFTNDGRDVDHYYVVAGSTKFLVLKDAKNVPLMNALNSHGGLYAELKPAGSFLFWAKYPAPPADAKKVNVHTPLAPPIEDVPLTESK